MSYKKDDLVQVCDYGGSYTTDEWSMSRLGFKDPKKSRDPLVGKLTSRGFMPNHVGKNMIWSVFIVEKDESYDRVGLRNNKGEELLIDCNVIIPYEKSTDTCFDILRDHINENEVFYRSDFRDVLHINEKTADRYRRSLELKGYLKKGSRGCYVRLKQIPNNLITSDIK